MIRCGTKVLGAFIDALSWDDVLAQIGDWAKRRESRYVCICNVHSVVTASCEQDFLRIVNAADMATPDGAPVAWMLRRLGFSGQTRINGPDLMLRYCEQAQRSGSKVFFYGSTAQTLALLEYKLLEKFEQLSIAGTYSPPFRPISDEENRQIVARINDSGAEVVFVSLGCPKQELWMAQQRGQIQAVMIGVGAAFDYHAGSIERAPLWMQNSGLEWLCRLCSEPRRLWRRYFVTNTLFLLGASWQLIRAKKQLTGAAIEQEAKV